MKKKEKTAVLIIAPETGRLPEGMGPLARYITGKSGGLGEVIASLCEGLAGRGVECHLATIYLKKRFQQECKLNDESWYKIRNRLDPGRIHLVSSSFFSYLPSAYAGNPLQNAAEFQKQAVNYIIPTLRARHGGRLIIHSHDWMSGGVITAYAKFRGCPILHTVHNVHTGQIPLKMLTGVELDRLTPYLYFSLENEPCGQIDQIGNLYGATATNRDTGGYHDKIEELKLAVDGASQDRGNGFLFRDYDAGGLWYGLDRSVEFHRRPPEVREKQLRRIMRETRQKHSLDLMVDQYIAVYERLNGNHSLE